jgi:hypothetical protein
MKILLKTLLTASALMVAMPASATILGLDEGIVKSDSQGTLVHTDGEETGTDVTGTLGSGPGAFEFVHFQGTTDATTNSDNVHLNGGNGQAEIDGAFVSGNDYANLLTGDIFLNTKPSGEGTTDDPTNLTFEWIELAFQNVMLIDEEADAFVEFTLYGFDENGLAETSQFIYEITGGGENWFAFLATEGETISNLHFELVNASADSLRQVRISTLEGGVPPVPEPGTWAMMLMGFGAAGYAMRCRRRTGVLAQVA